MEKQDEKIKESELEYYDKLIDSESIHHITSNIRSWALHRELYTNGDLKSQFVKLSEEVGELAQGILKNDNELIEDSIGDIFVVLTNVAVFHGIESGDTSNCFIEKHIVKAWNEIKDRKGKMKNGTFVKDE